MTGYYSPTYAALQCSVTSMYVCIQKGDRLATTWIYRPSICHVYYNRSGLDLATVDSLSARSSNALRDVIKCFPTSSSLPSLLSLRYYLYIMYHATRFLKHPLATRGP